MRRLLSDDDLGVKPVAEINMTNLIDVTMVLLIVFILIAPVIDQGFTLDLPTAAVQAIDAGDPLNLVVAPDGRVHLAEKVYTLDELFANVRALAERKKGEIDVVILADRDLPYGKVVAVMDVVRRAGLSRLSLATREERTP